VLSAALGGQGGTVKEMDVDMPGQDTNNPEVGVKGRWSNEEDDTLM